MEEWADTLPPQQGASIEDMMRRTIGATLFALAFATVSEAQAPERRASNPPPAPTPRASVGHAAQPAPPPQPVPVQVAQPVYYYYYSQSPYDYAIYGAPYLVLNDGSVLVNLGNGYERVLRQCAPVRPTAPVDPWARDALGRIPPPPAIAALQAGTRGQAIGNAPGRNSEACFRTDGQRVEMVTTR